MPKKNKRDNSVISIVVDLILAAAYTWCICATSACAMGFKVNTELFYLLPAVVVLFFCFLLWNKWTILSGSLVFVIFIGYFTVWRKSSLINFFNYLIRIYKWLYNYVQYWGTPDFTYSTILYIILCTTVGLLSWILINKKFNFYILAVAGLCLFVTQFIFEFLNFMPAFYVYVFVLLILYAKFVFYSKIPSFQTENGDVESVKKGLFIINYIPVAFIVLCMALVLPYSKDTVFTWKWLDHTLNATYEKAYDFVCSIREGKIFSLADTGFSEDASFLGGSVSVNEASVLKVNTPKRIYLKGRVYDVYTGKGWINSESKFYDFKGSDSSEIKELDFSNAYINIINGLSLDNQNYEILKDISVKYLSSNLRTIFIPQRMFEFEYFNKDIRISFNQHIGMVGDKRFRKGDEYRLSAYSLKRSEYVEKALKTTSKGLYHRLADNGSKESRLFRRRAAYDFIKYAKELNEKARHIYSKYLVVPDNLPQRVIDLSKQVVLGSQSEYEAAKKIEKYLSSNFPYTLNPGRIPKDADFVDYFLFENKKGYCTYYASAMVIMCRVLGIPARYVEGYSLPDKEDSTGGYIVTNRQAHAWVEVYFEGIGWLEFEPTAAFHDPYYSQDVRVSEPYNVFEPDFLYDERYKDYIKGLPGMDGYQWYFPEQSKGQEIEKSKPFLLMWYYWVGLIILLFFIYVLLRCLIFNAFYRSAAEKGNRYLIVYYYYNIAYLFKYFGRQKNHNETVIEYGERLEKYIYKGDFSIIKVMEIFSKALYSKEECTKNELDYVINFYDFMHKEMRNTYGILKYLIYILKILLFSPFQREL